MSTINLKLLKENFLGDEDILGEILESFKEQKDSMLEEIISSGQDGDYEVFERASHTLKGVISNFFAEATKEKIAKLEEMGRNKNIDGHQEKLDEVSREIDLIISQIEQFLRGSC